MGTRVLVVEDNPINAELIEYLLQAFGFETLRAADGRSGLETARRERPDLILCDIQMPVMDGFEFARCLREDPLLRTTPLLAVTAYAMVGDCDRILAQGFDAYVSKPIEPQALVAAVGAALSSSTQRRVPATMRPESSERATGRSRGLVLVLDDVAENRALIHDLLEPHGYEVVSVGTTEAAWSRATRRRPDLILSDVGMARGDGFDFVRRVKADPDLRAVPFVFLSSTHWDEATRGLGLALGALRYLRRPIEPQVLLAELEACLAR
jgi:two-component system cell cycle response regulator